MTPNPQPGAKTYSPKKIKKKLMFLRLKAPSWGLGVE